MTPMASAIKPGVDRDLEEGMLTQEPSVLINSLDGKKNFVKQVIGSQNDTELHLAARQGDLAAVKQILASIDSQIIGMVSNEDFGAEVAKCRAALVNEENKLGETALYIAAERGYLDVVRELLKYSNKECLAKKSRQGLDAFHVAAIQGHHAIVQVLLEHNPTLVLSTDFFHTTALESGAREAHIEVAGELLAKDYNSVKISRSDGKIALHLAARNGHAEVVKALLKNDPQLARWTDKKGQTALHMATKGQNSEVVKLLIEADTAVLTLPDMHGNTALHTATRKKRYEIVKELLVHPEVNVNALTLDKKTALDIAEELGSKEIKDYLLHKGAVRSKELKRMLQGRMNNTSSANKTAILIAQLAFAAIFTIPGETDNGDNSLLKSGMSIKILVIFNSIAFFASLAVIVIHITLSKGVQEVEVLATVTDIAAILIWVASVCVSVVFMTATFVVVGRHFEGVTILITVTSGMILIGSICIRTYYEMKLRRNKLIGKKVK